MRLFETIRIENGKVLHLDYHQKRFERSRREVFARQEPLLLKDYITIEDRKATLRCKLIYDERGVCSVQYFPYAPKKIASLRLIRKDIEYGYKYMDRSVLQADARGCDEPLFVSSEGLITDTSIANVAFFDGTKWLTPAVPLLQGTTRERYLDNKQLQLADIEVGMLHKFQKIAFLNAMIGFSVKSGVKIQDKGEQCFLI